MPTCSVEGCTTNLNKRSLAKGDGVCSAHRRKYPPVSKVLCSHEGCQTTLKGSSLKRKDGLCSRHKPNADKITTQQRERLEQLEEREQEYSLVWVTIDCLNDGDGNSHSLSTIEVSKEMAASGRLPKKICSKCYRRSDMSSHTDDYTVHL